MKIVRLLPVLLMAHAIPAAAERLQFDHRLYPPLKAVLDSKRPEMIDFNNKNPKYVVDRIAVQGSSANQWVEAIDIIARASSRDVQTAENWFAEIREKTSKACQSQFTIIEQDENSVTFSRRSTKCGADKVQFALYRIVAGKRTLFLLNPIYRNDMTETMQQQWLALLRSARLED